MKTILLILTSLVAASTSAYATDCFDRFRSEVHGRSLAEKRAIAMKLGAKELECLFDKAGSEPTGPAFYLDAAHRDSKRVQAFAGKNSLLVGAKFDKHFFGGPGGQIYGYNSASVNRLLHSPGFFRVIPDPRDVTKMTFDYREDFVSALRGIDLKSYAGAKVRAVRNNTGNLIFGGLTDVMKKIDGDIAIGKAFKKGKAQSTFILVRLP